MKRGQIRCCKDKGKVDFWVVAIGMGGGGLPCRSFPEMAGPVRSRRSRTF